MKRTEHARRSSRYALRWNASVVFDHVVGKPIVQTRTEDLSVDGAGIFSPYGDVTGSVVHLLLAHPARESTAEAPGVLKARARVVSTVRTPGMAQYRHGLRFLRSPGDGLGLLGELLKRGAAVAAGGPTGKSAQVMQAPVVHTAGGLQGEFNPIVSVALQKACAYLKDLAQRLNVEHPAYGRGYTIAGVPEFSGLAWEEGQADCDTRELFSTVTVYERVSLRFRLSGKKQIQVDREFPASERLRQWLADGNISFETQGMWSKRGSLQGTRFVFPCQVDASLLLEGQHETGSLLMRARNVAGFGLMEQILAPEAMVGRGLDDLAALVLGETWRLGTLLDA
jgi:PilZ domain-containing protein